MSRSQRHLMESRSRPPTRPPPTTSEAGEESGFARFRMIRRTLIAALALPHPLVIIMLRDLVPTPEEEGKSPAEILSTTIWRADSRIVSDGTYRPVRPRTCRSAAYLGGARGPTEIEEIQGNLNARGKAAIILIRMEPDEIRSQQGEGWTTRDPGTPRRSAPTWAA